MPINLGVTIYQQVGSAAKQRRPDGRADIAIASHTYSRMTLEFGAI